MTTVDPYANLPKELIIEQALQLPTKDVLALAETSSRLNTVIASDEFWRQKFIHDYGPISWKDSCLQQEIDAKLDAIIKGRIIDPQIELARRLGELGRVFIGLKVMKHPIEHAAILTAYVNSPLKTHDQLVDILDYMIQVGIEHNEEDGEAVILDDEDGELSYWITNIESDDDVVMILKHFFKGRYFHAFGLQDISESRRLKIEPYIEDLTDRGDHGDDDE